MVATATWDPTGGLESLRLDDQGILWHKTKSLDDRGVMVIDGQGWCAQRRIHPPAVILAEAAQAGFEIIEKQIRNQTGGADMLRAVFSPSGSISHSANG